jgi:peptide deformylase
MIQPIIQAPDTRLHVVAQPLPEALELQHRQAVKDLIDTFDDTRDCIGLAATQLGLNWRVIVVDITPRRSETYMMINPVIVKMSEDLQVVRDGCMSISFGKKHANTKRPKRLIVEWRDPIDGSLQKQKFSGLLAAAVHHEVDHLDGVLFVDRIVANELSRGVL